MYTKRRGGAAVTLCAIDPKPQAGKSAESHSELERSGSPATTSPIVRLQGFPVSTRGQ